MIIVKFKIFENYKQKRIDNIMNIINSCKIGDIIDEDIIYQYVQILHGNHDFIEGDLGKRIEEYSKYKFSEIDISKLNIDEYYLFDNLVDKYVDKYNKNGYYPPIVISNTNRLIDGNHRSNALNKLGFKKVKAFVGIK